MSLTIEHLPADVLGLGPAASAALRGRPHPPALAGMTIPADLGAIPRPPDRDADDREELAASLQASLAPYEPHVAVLEATRSLAREGAALVLAGQQPGLFGGPLYNVYKALHAVRLARALTEAWGVPVVAGFWNHADDHDVAEVHHLWVQNENLDLRKVGLAGVSSGRTPLGQLVFDGEEHRLPATAELMDQLLWDGPAHTEALELCLPRHGETFASAFTRVLLRLFGHLGLVVIEPDAIRERLSRRLSALVGGDVQGPLAAGTAGLVERGLPAPIDPERAALVFHHEEGGRRALRFAADGYRYDDEPGSRTPAELAAEILQSPHEWSAGALLRPLVQDTALPVAAYVGGWGELAYHAQLPPLRDAAGAPHTPFVPRLSATLVDPDAERSLETLGVSVRDVLAARGRLSEGADEDAPAEPEVAAAMRALGEATASSLLELRDELEAIDRGLARQLRRVGDQVRGAIGKLADKAGRASANQAGRGRRHHRRLDSGLMPRGEPQERVRGLVELIARFGTGWIDELLDEFEPFPTEHLVVHLDDLPRGDA